MKALVVGKNRSAIESLIIQMGFSLVGEEPDFVVSYGGDGTLMRAETLFPGVPKVILKGSAVCKRCSPLPNREVLARVRGGEYKIKGLIKLEARLAVRSDSSETRRGAPAKRARAEGRMLTAMNDIIVHNADPRHAIRYQLTVDGKAVGGIIVGDGIVVATPFGSTAYYRSITDSSFGVGIGLAFNNSTEQADHMVLSEAGVIALTVVRGPAVVYADNQEGAIALGEGDGVVVAKSRKTAKMVTVG